jgi:tetratricopeptide (TPR) repeat protein
MPVVELFHHLVSAGQYDEACFLFYRHLNQKTNFQFGAYQLRIELLSALFSEPPVRECRVSDEQLRMVALNALGGSFSHSGQTREALALIRRYVELAEKQHDKRHLAVALGNIADIQMATGDLTNAETNLRRRITLCASLAEHSRKATGHQQLGLLRMYQGAWTSADTELDEGCRATSTIETEAELLTELARVRAQQRDYDEARSLAEEALLISERCNYKYQTADAHAVLAQIADIEGDGGSIRRHLAEAVSLCGADEAGCRFGAMHDTLVRLLGARSR